MDTYENHGGIGFDINASGILKGATTFLSGGKSQTLAFSEGSNGITTYRRLYHGRGR